MQNGLQLMIIILRNKKIFQITNQIIRIIWYTLFKYPFVDVLLPLLELSEPKEFSEFIEELHNQLVCLIYIYIYNTILYNKYILN